MKVRLKNKSRVTKNALTPGNVYRVIGIECDYFRIMNDFGEPILYNPILFEVIDCTFNKTWVTHICEDGARCSYPPMLQRPGFFEDWFAHDRAVMMDLYLYLVEMARED